MSRFRKGSLVLIFILVTALLLGGSAAFAEGTNPGGGDRSDSPGVPGHKPLNFVGITLDDGSNVQNATDVPLKPKFRLEFDKNVVNIVFWERNRRCFNLFDGGNNAVPINVTKVDDTVDFSQRQYIFVEPINPLLPGTSYHLTVSGELMAKNGNSTLGGTTGGKGISISFRTAGQKSPSVTTEKPVGNEVPGKPTGEPASNKQSSQGQPEAQLGTTSTQPASSEAALEQEQSDTTVTEDNPANSGETSSPLETNEENPTSAQGRKAGFSDYVPYLAGVLIAAWILVEIYLRKKGKR